ncbi:MAG: 50S ribosomal protein L15 [Candidatus Omnitrophica bacterium]|nr:50S ribosomal protein L15 [Candidatus Omnitrophota bacterium]
MKLENIRSPKGANRKSKRVGRGSGSGHGKTSGRGMKGAKSRSGYSRRFGFEGGQMPLARRIPKRGFIQTDRNVYQIVNVEKLNHFKKDSSVDKMALKNAGFIKKETLPVKILGEGKISKPLTISVEAFSESAKKKIIEAGGRVDITRTKDERRKTKDVGPSYA